MDKNDGGLIPNGTYENQVITQTVMTEDLFTGVAIGTFQEDFRLCEADFLRLRNEATALTTWAVNVLFASIGYGMSILPKWISEFSGKPDKVSQSEWFVLIAGLVVSFALFLASKYITNEKKELLNRMAKFFKSAPKTRQFVRGKNDNN